MVATKHQTIDTADLGYFIRKQLEAGYQHFAVDLTVDVRTGKPKKDFRRVVVRYWHPQVQGKLKLSCEDCGKEVPSSTALKVHQVQKGHGPYRSRPT